MTTKEKHILDPNIKLSASIIVVSDSLASEGSKKWLKLDQSAKIAREILFSNKINVTNVTVIPDEIDKIEKIVRNELKTNIDLLLTIGGTGISKRDVTIEAVRPILEKEMPGFGELFRLKTYEEVGTVSIMTRTIAGVNGKTCIVCLPGSPNAVQLGTTLILKELLHIANLRR